VCVIKIISHRGYWKSIEEKNSKVAFERSFSQGFGIETDIRDYRGKIVISHNIANEKCVDLDYFYKLYKRFDDSLLLAIDIKADGLQKKLKELILKNEIRNYFVFDMSIPDAMAYINEGLNAFTRQSEYETEPSFYKYANGIVIDGFFTDWVKEKDINNHLKNGKKVCLISPELHDRPHKLFWKKLTAMNVLENDELIICTDFPKEAKRFFYGR